MAETSRRRPPPTPSCSTRSPSSGTTLDPPPDDLAEGVLARIETNDLDAELLTLVEWDKELSGVRSVTMLRAPDEVGTWSLEYLGPGFRVQVRISRSARQARLDGWVVPGASR